MTERTTPAPPTAASMRAEVWAGLQSTPKRLSPKWFYDAAGSALFDEITRLPEYYPTRTERALLERFAPPWMAGLAPRALVELGPGSADKTRILLDAMRRPGSVYAPVDISETYLDTIAREVGREYPHIDVVPILSDFTRAVDLPDDVPAPAVIAFLGSTIGNFDRPAAVQLLRGVRAALRDDDRLLLGVDLVKDTATLEAAYNDRRGVTAAFNRNMLHVLNREVGTDFDIGAFRHRAFFDRQRSRIEMHLVADGEQRVHVPGHGAIRFADGESVRTEISCKYDRPAVAAMFAAAGLDIEAWRTDARGWYALVVGRAAR